MVLLSIILTVAYIMEPAFLRYPFSKACTSRASFKPTELSCVLMMWKHSHGPTNVKPQESRNQELSSNSMVPDIIT